MEQGGLPSPKRPRFEMTVTMSVATVETAASVVASFEKMELGEEEEVGGATDDGMDLDQEGVKKRKEIIDREVKEWIAAGMVNEEDIKMLEEIAEADSGPMQPFLANKLLKRRRSHILLNLLSLGVIRAEGGCLSQLFIAIDPEPKPIRVLQDWNQYGLGGRDEMCYGYVY